jgi:hypothetical protein
MHCFDLCVAYSCVDAASNTSEDRRVLNMNNCCDISFRFVIVVEKRFVCTSNCQINNFWYHLTVKDARDTLVSLKLCL